MFKHKKNKELGITLIALVATIIVLLILAGISISMLMGDSGVLTKTADAKTMYEEESFKQQLKSEVLGNYNKERELNAITLKDTIEKKST